MVAGCRIPSPKRLLRRRAEVEKMPVVGIRAFQTSLARFSQRLSLGGATVSAHVNASIQELGAKEMLRLSLQALSMDEEAWV